ncbi:hypothetical protein F4604DRAFT_152985 [Suillus subluteus]|nr:hypothetical protein F4604DRAFT_152985 [Suillus subluteus]
MSTVFKGSLSCKKILRFITEPDRQHECEEFCGISRVEYERLVSFIDESYNFGVRPRMTYIEADSTLIVEMPSAVHEAPLVEIRTALTCLFENIPFDHQAVNVNISNYLEASHSLDPDLRISFQNMRSAACNIMIPSLAETVSREGAVMSIPVTWASISVLSSTTSLSACFFCVCEIVIGHHVRMSEITWSKRTYFRQSTKDHSIPPFPPKHFVKLQPSLDTSGNPCMTGTVSSSRAPQY